MTATLRERVLIDRTAASVINAYAACTAYVQGAQREQERGKVKLR